MSTKVLDRPISYEEERGQPAPRLDRSVGHLTLGSILRTSRARLLLSELTISILGTNDLGAVFE